ncbi:MAG: PEP-CTERM sorting domain-containing protein [Patescibacteria group bacterium]|nr:PEP-CTERM sorting domain-containing protein [Patescibacteria group bacterium]
MNRPFPVYPRPGRPCETTQQTAAIAVRLALLALVLNVAANVSAIEFANIDVVQHNAGNTTTSVTVTAPQATAGFTIRAGSNRGDYNVQIGDSASDDPAGGILITSVRENGRDNDAFGDTTGFTLATSTISPTASGYYIPVFSAPQGAEFNINLAAAYFPFAEGWIAGAAYNSTNGGAITSLNASSGMALRAAYAEDGTQQFIHHGNGQFELYLPGIDARADGVLLVTGAKDEDNYALSAPSADGSHFRIAVHDNGANGHSYEQDPVAFAYIPLGTPGATLGRVEATGGIYLGQGDFEVRRVDTGTWRLTIAGQTPTSGTLMVSPAGFEGDNGDNIVTYEAHGDGWLIQSRDLPQTPPTLQNCADLTSVFNFAFLPFDSVPTAPGTSLPVNRNQVSGANVRVTEYNPGNATGDMGAVVTESNNRMTVAYLNRGDNRMALGGVLLGESDGVLLGTIREHVRDNSATLGLTDYGVISTYTSGGAWVVATATGDGRFNGTEHNIDFATAWFPHSAGFAVGANAATTGGIATITIDGAGDTRTSGVLLTTSFGNEDNFTAVQPLADGTGWTVQNRDNSSSLENGGVNYAFLPYGTENLVAAQVSSAGYILSKTGQFDLVREGAGLYRLSIAGQSVETGVLLLNTTTVGNSSDNFLVYRGDGNDFLIHGIDAQNNNTHGLQDTDFVFAFLPFEEPVGNPQLRPFDPRAISAANIRVIQNDVGTGATSVSVWAEQGSDNFTIHGGNRGDFHPSIDGSPISLANGILMATVRANGRDNGDGVGTVYGVVSVEHNSLNPNMWIPVDRIGSKAETNIDLAAAFFPFEGGYIGGHFSSAAASLKDTLPVGSSLTRTATGRYRLTMPDIDSRTDGLLFAINGSNTENTFTAAVTADGTGWDIGSYDSRANLGTFENEDFSLLYLPMATTHGIAALGRMGADGAVLAGDGNFQVSRTGLGEYLLELGGGFTAEDGMLLLTVAELQEGVPADNVLSYEAYGEGFLIQSRDLPGASLEDVAFAFAFVNFHVPEPSTGMLLVLALGGLLVSGNRRRERRRDWPASGTP